MSENVETTLKQGEETAVEKFAESEYAEFVIAPYQLEPSHAARLLGRMASLYEIDDDTSSAGYAAMMDSIADAYEYIRDNCVLPGRREDFVNLFRGDFERLGEFVTLYVAAVGESGRSGS